MDTDDESQLAQERNPATTEKRKALALERVADHLQRISRGFDRIVNLRAGHVPFEGMTVMKGRGANDQGDEGADAEQESRDALEIEQTPVEHFAVGGYNYTNLAHAIAQAKRDRLNGEHR